MKNLLYLCLIGCFGTMIACEPTDSTGGATKDDAAEQTSEIADESNADDVEDGGEDISGNKDNAETAADTQTDESSTDAEQSSAGRPKLQPGPNFGEAIVQQWYEPKDRVPYVFDFDMADHTAETFNLTQLHGKPTAVSFMFTNCKLLSMCPMLTSNMASLEKKLVEQGLGDKVNLVLISYDPKRDTPEALATFGKQRGVTFDVIRMLRPKLETHQEFREEWEQMDTQYFPDGDIGHYLDLYLFDAHGRVARIYSNGHWKNDLVMADLKTLLAEQDAADESPAEGDEESSDGTDAAKTE